jgi:protein phosphatase
VGVKRNHNEDTVLWMPEVPFAAVMDGMGGQSTGYIPANLVRHSLSQFWEQHPLDRWPPGALRQGRPLQLAFQLAHLRICMEIAQSRGTLRGQSSTAVALLLVPGGACIAHAGDSRAYRLRGGRIQLLTEDHSLINHCIKHQPALTPEQLAQLPKNVITRVLGMDTKDESWMADLRFEPLEPGDRFLLCSDGLNRMLPDREIEAIWAGESNLQRLGARLVARANEAGGDDNIGLVLVDEGDQAGGLF